MITGLMSEKTEQENTVKNLPIIDKPDDDGERIDGRIKLESFYESVQCV